MKRLMTASLLLLALGCSKPTVGIVSGTVTVDGQPAPNGSIAFYPLDGKSKVTGGVIEQGKYSVEVPPGTSRVEIRVSTVVGQQRLYDTPDSPVQPIMQEILPPIYNDRSELTLDVVVGPNEKNYDLKSMQRKK